MANMFPDIPTDVPAQTAESIGRVPAFDSASERFLLLDGALVERSGRAAVQQWFDLMLRQQIDRVPIYTTDGETKLGIDRSLLKKDGILKKRLDESAYFQKYGFFFRDFPGVKNVLDLLPGDSDLTPDLL